MGYGAGVRPLAAGTMPRGVHGAPRRDKTRHGPYTAWNFYTVFTARLLESQ